MLGLTLLTFDFLPSGLSQIFPETFRWPNRVVGFRDLHESINPYNNLVDRRFPGL